MSEPVPKAALYYFPTSVWCAPPLLALEEKGYGADELDLKLVDISKGENYAPSYLRLNPQATVPTLVVPLQKTLAADMESRYKAIQDSKVTLRPRLTFCACSLTHPRSPSSSSRRGARICSTARTMRPDIRVGDLVIVEADRGKDLGKVINDTITLAEVEAFQKQQKLMNYADVHGVPTSPHCDGAARGPLATKMQDEIKALELCRNKVRQRKLPMEVVDAEYQWDRRKLTFYFIAEKRIDFRELVRELFRLYKTRIWMASLGGPGGYEQ
ncbi:hypothetical protein EVJ58_g3551 [Rhodofomes roseus]|uniref:PSP1 C-terminal domain-containing protein n=1 Tax=Rhodofomes roseus TaxID=34475 RepID=A0A4Y9YN37_9APHY|nr:hypothetical protein EVJ58_g3551 [Rhodofomes roseus]